MENKSLPLLGAWIEITYPRVGRVRQSRRSLCWERGLKCLAEDHHLDFAGVAPFAGSVD